MTGSRGPGRGPSWGEYRSGGTEGSHPGIKVPDLPPGVRPISQSQGTEGTRRGSPSWGEYRSGGTGGSHKWIEFQQINNTIACLQLHYAQ